jgi:hypothetical protein
LSVNGDEVLALISQQLRYGPRGHDRVRDLLIAEMDGLAQDMITQSFDHAGPDGKTYRLTNIIGRLHDTEERRVIVAAHYDGVAEPAAGPALLLELTRALITAPDAPRVGIDIVLLDAAGSSWFATHVGEIYGTKAPVSVLLLDSACRGEVRVLKDPTAIGDPDNPPTPAGDAPRSCSVRNLEKAARTALDYVNTMQ